MQRRQVTLKEKLSEHYQKRNFHPKKQATSYMSMAFFAGMVVTLFIENLVLLLPNFFMDEAGNIGGSYRIAQIFVIFVFIQCVINWWQSYYDVPNRVTKELKSEHFPNLIETPPGWKNCPTCMLDAPPRSHHCSLCNYCILKRDHHCFFTGSCVGFHNQGSFVFFCLYAVIGTFFTNYLQLAYLNKEYPLFSSAAFFYFPLYALWQFLTGAASFVNTFIVMHFCATIGSLGTAVFFLGWHIIIISRGQTSYEAWKQINIYKRSSITNNFYSVFGSPVQMIVRFLIPKTITLPENGVKWTIDSKSEKGH